ncbi:acetyl-CoA carboxylase biotin carboxyl carrier protein [Pusillimonas sp.]|uniref:acetyl-CoA carboxylase biotin carboxyl carrier protein n=1 Tax=Pusillimonas sp. TaxID=3040095 RepID=UPI0037CC650C
MSFTHADVQNIIQLLDASHFDELVLEMDGIKLELRRGGAAAQAAAPTAAPRAEAASLPAASAADVSPAQAPSTAATQPTAATAGLQEIRAPMLGTYYSAPKPGAAPFVSVGDRVEADTVVGIIEVMKLMNSTSAGISGEIVEVLVKDGDLVEYDQPLMRVRA